MKYKYVRIDCDNVGDKIELCLYKFEPEKAQIINNLIRRCIHDLAETFKTTMNSEILLIGADDLLIKIPIDEFDFENLKVLKESFFFNTEITLSIGVGNDIIEAMRNLDIAKRSGKNIIYMK